MNTIEQLAKEIIASIEEEDKNIKITNNTLELSFKPFEIKTIKIKRNCK